MFILQNRLILFEYFLLRLNIFNYLSLSVEASAVRLKIHESSVRMWPWRIFLGHLLFSWNRTWTSFWILRVYSWNICWPLNKKNFLVFARRVWCSPISNSWHPSECGLVVVLTLPHIVFSLWVASAIEAFLNCFCFFLLSSSSLRYWNCHVIFHACNQI